MSETLAAFFEDRLIARGAREDVTRLVEDRFAASDHGAIRVFDEATMKVTDLDYWDAGKSAAALPSAVRGRGRPKLGVVAREVTLLPRQWEWLGTQPGGASAAIRRLVEEARKAAPPAGMGRDAAYRFMTEMAGDRPGYEEAIRALYRGDHEKVREIAGDWPDDIRAYLGRLLG
jgi:hypothetical protein